MAAYPYVETHGFGSGVLWGIPSGSNPTPVRFGVLQDCSVDFTFTTKELFGQFQFPVDLGRGTAKIAGKANFAAIQKDVMSKLFFNVTPAAPMILDAVDEAGTIPGTPYAVTVTNSATWTDDLGVLFTATGAPLTRVASGPATGQYSVAAGVYTFAAADTTLAVLISYRYTGATLAGFRSIITNQLLGEQPIFGIDFFQKSQKARSTQQWNLRLYKSVSSKLTIASKLEDFIIPAFEFSAYADDSNNVGELNTPN